MCSMMTPEDRMMDGRNDQRSCDLFPLFFEASFLYKTGISLLVIFQEQETLLPGLKMKKQLTRQPCFTTSDRPAHARD